MSWVNVEAEQLLEPPLILKDFVKSVRSSRPTISHEDLKRNEEWTNEFGSEGAWRITLLPFSLLSPPLVSLLFLTHFIWHLQYPNDFELIMSCMAAFVAGVCLDLAFVLSPLLTTVDWSFRLLGCMDQQTKGMSYGLYLCFLCFSLFLPLSLVFWSGNYNIRSIGTAKALQFQYPFLSCFYLSTNPSWIVKKLSPLWSCWISSNRPSRLFGHFSLRAW